VNAAQRPLFNCTNLLGAWSGVRGRWHKDGQVVNGAALRCARALVRPLDGGAKEKATMWPAGHVITLPPVCRGSAAFLPPLRRL